MSNDQSTNIYETDLLASQYINFHYGYQQTPKTLISSVANFAAVVGDFCLSVLYSTKSEPQPYKILDLGCAVGRSSLNMARGAQEVIGIDYSHKFVDLASRIVQNGKMSFNITRQGDILDNLESDLSSNEIKAQNTQSALWIKNNFSFNFPDFIQNSQWNDVKEKCTFLQGDACNLPLTGQLSNFDLVLGANLIDRLYDPNQFLTKIGSHIKQGGYLVLTSPYTWLEQYTPKDKWIGARDNETTLQALGRIFNGSFEPVNLKGVFNIADYSDLELEGSNAFSVPFVIKETERKYQLTYAQLSVWKKL